jgi:tetratricopeptide (TPR) repeat protein
MRLAGFTGDIPQNVNFALKAEIARTFLDSKGVAYRTARSDQQLTPADVGDIGRPFTVHIACERRGSQTAAAPSMVSPAPRNRIQATQQQISWCQTEVESVESLPPALKLKNADLILKGCTAVIQSNRSAWAFNNRGIALKGDYERGIADFNEAIALDSNFVKAFSNRALAYILKRDFDRAIADYNRAVELDTDCAKCLFGRGFAYRLKLDYENAIHDFTTVSKSSSTQLASKAANQIGELYAKGQGVQKNCDYARRWLDQAARAGVEVAKRDLLSGVDGQCHW